MVTLTAAGLISGCTDQDGTNVNDALNSQSACETTTQAFQANVLGLSNISCEQTSLKDSSLLGLLLLAGVDISQNNLGDIGACQGSVLLKISCRDPFNIIVFTESCTIQDSKPVCSTQVSPNNVLLTALANALGVSGGSLDLTVVQNALTSCGVDPNASLVSLTDAQTQCLITAVRGALGV